MNSMREKSEYRGESKEGIIEAVLPQRALFDKEEGLVILMFGSCRNRHIFTLPGMQPVQERRSTGSLRDDAKLSPEKYSSCLADRLQETLELSLKRREDSHGLGQSKVQFFWVSYFSHGYILGTILKITSSPDTHSKDYLSGNEDRTDALLKARFNRLFWVL